MPVKTPLKWIFAN